MKIESSSARIEGAKTHKGLSAFMDTLDLAHGYAATVAIYPTCSHVVLAKRKDPGDSIRLYVIALPSAEWLDGITDEFEVVQTLSPAPQPHPPESEAAKEGKA